MSFSYQFITMRSLTHLFLATAPWLALASPTLDIEPRQAQKITIDVTKKYQTMDGFGISAAFQRANLIVNLKEPKQTEVLDLLFNTSSGAGFSILRNGVGSSKDSSSDHMNTIEPNCPATPDATPTYVWDGKDSGQLWLSQKAIGYGVKQFYANAWSAPGCMKTNGNDATGGKLCGVCVIFPVSISSEASKRVVGMDTRLQQSDARNMREKG